MTNAITINGTVQTRINGIGSALRCVAVVGRDVRARHERHLLPLHAPGKRLDAASMRPSMPESMSFSMSTGAWQRPAQAAPKPAAAAADLYLPPAAWASFVIARTISA